jgi:hypothetical protein
MHRALGGHISTNPPYICGGYKPHEIGISLKIFASAPPELFRSIDGFFELQTVLTMSGHARGWV